MPANLPPHYYKLEKEFKQERDPREKLRLAKELLALMPKHKGTDKLQAELKARISKLKSQVESGGARHGAHRADVHDHIDKQGAAQIILIGPPNSGKSSILDSLTHAEPAVADFPYTTQEPLAGMAIFETVPLQLIDTPPISAEHMDPYLPNLVRQADLVVAVIDVASQQWEAEWDVLTSRLAEKRIILAPSEPPESEDPRLLHKVTLIAAHKYLDEGGSDGLHALCRRLPDFCVIPTSILEDESLVRLQREIFGALKVIRVYTKRVGHEADFDDPIILPMGSTVDDAARHIHKDFAHNLQFARIWGEGKFEGQRVKNSYVLADRDVVEFHT